MNGRGEEGLKVLVSDSWVLVSDSSKNESGHRTPGKALT